MQQRWCAAEPHSAQFFSVMFLASWNPQTDPNVHPVGDGPCPRGGTPRSGGGTCGSTAGVARGAAAVARGAAPVIGTRPGIERIDVVGCERNHLVVIHGRQALLERRVPSQCAAVSRLDRLCLDDAGELVADGGLPLRKLARHVVHILKLDRQDRSELGGFNDELLPPRAFVRDIRRVTKIYLGLEAMHGMPRSWSNTPARRSYSRASFRARFVWPELRRDSNLANISGRGMSP